LDWAECPANNAENAKIAMPDQDKKSIPNATDAPASAKPVKFIHRQPDHLPTFHAEGAWGLMNPQGFIRVGFYTENPTSPKVIIQPVNAEGLPTGPATEEGMEDNEYFVMIRDFQCNVVLSLSGAVQVYQMLGNFIRLGQQQMKEQITEMQSQLKEAEKKTTQQVK
jgi:hypothetical protein